MARYTLAAIVSALLLLQGTEGQAQANQTPEGAQSFIFQIFSQGSTKIKADMGRGFNTYLVKKERCEFTPKWVCSGLGTERKTYQAYVAMSTSSKNVCTTVIQVKNDLLHTVLLGTTREVPNGGRFGGMVELSTTPEANSFPQMPFYIDWKKVAEIKQNDTSVIMRGAKPDLHFSFASESIATRMAYAMEFLRLHCDPTASTGF